MGFQLNRIIAVTVGDYFTWWQGATNLSARRSLNRVPTGLCVHSRAQACRTEH